MNGITTQEQRLDYLAEAFKTDSGAYRNLDIPDSIEGKKARPQVPYEYSYAGENGVSYT